MARPKPTWADYYAAVGAQARANAAARGGGSGPSIDTSLSRYSSSPGQFKDVGGSSGGGGGRSTGPKLYQQPLDWSEPTNLIAHGIANIPFIGDNIMKSLEDPTSMGSGIIDALSRGTFASESGLTELSKQVGKEGDPGYTGRPNDIGKILGAVGAGAMGTSKKTALDYYESQGYGNKGWGAFLRNTLQDVAFDPLSWVGPGLIGKVGRLAKAGGASSKTLLKGTEDLVNAGKITDDVPVPAAAIPAATNPIQDTLPGLDPSVQDPLSFLERLNAGGLDEAAPSPAPVVQGAPAPTGAPAVAAPDFAGLMEQLGIRGEGQLPIAPLADETVPPVPAAALLTARAKMGQADELAQGISQRNYAPATAAAIPESGFWNEVTTKVPVAAAPEKIVEQLTPAVGEDVAEAFAQTVHKSPMPTFAYERTQNVNRQHAKVAALEGEDLADIEPGSIERIVLEDLNAKVPTEYIENPNFGKGDGWSEEWIPNPKKPNFRTVGELRYIDTHPYEFSDAVVKRAAYELSEYQAVHLRHAELYDAVFDDGYINHIYGAKAPVKAAPKAKGKRTTALPPGPMKPVPQYKEIKEFKELDEAEKAAILTRLDEELGIQPEHVEFLAQADNLKDYKARVEIVKDSMRTSKDIQDVAEGIRSGRITSKTDPGIPEALALFNVKTLKGLESQITKAVENLSKQEQKLVDKYFPVDKEGNPLPPKTEPYPSSPAKVPAVTPQGRKVEKMAQEAAEKAQTPATPATQQVVESAMKGDASDFVDIMPTLDAGQHGMLARAIDVAMKEGAVKGLKLPYRTKAGNVAKSDKKYGVGDTIRLDSWNKNTQQNGFRSILKDADDWYASKKAGGAFEGNKFMLSNPGRAIQLYNRTMPVLKNLDVMLKKRGIFPVAGTTNNHTAISMFDALDSIDTKWVQKNVFGVLKRKSGQFESTIQPTQILDALEVGLSKMVANGGKLPDDIGDLKALMLKAATMNRSNKGNRVPNHVKSTHKTPEELDAFIQPLIDALPELYKRGQVNGVKAKKYHDDQVDAGTQAAIEEMARLIESPSKGHRDMMELANTWQDRVLKPAVEAHHLNPEDAAATATNVVAAEQIPPSVSGAGKEATESAGASPATRTKQDVHRQQAAEADAQKQNPAGSSTDIKEDSVIARTIQKIFPAFGNENIHGLRASRATHDKNVHHLAVAQLTKANSHGTTLNVNAFNALKLNKTLTAAENGAEAAAAQKDMTAAIQMIFGPKGMSVFETVGLKADDVNHHLQHFKVPERYHLDPRKDLHDQWKTWETDDVISLLDQYTQAVINATTKKHIGDSIMAEPLWASSTPKKGYHKFELPKDSELGHYIDVDNMYYHEDIIKEMRVYDRFLKDTISWNKLNHTKTVKYYDEVFHAWKAGVTVYRPGHHVRNGIGDIWFNYMAGMTNPKWYAKAVELQKAMPAGMYDDFGAVGQLLRGVDAPVKELKGAKAAAGQPFVHTTINGKRHGLTMQEIIREAEKRGLLPDYKTGEDISGSAYKGSIREKLQTGGPVARRIAAPTGGRVKGVVTKASEAREHNVRLAQFMFELDKKGYKSLDEALDQSAARVRKWHPDGSDLTPMEQNLFRRTAGFYSWIRKAIPLVMEGMVTRPGRFMVYPKAMYNLAESRGIDLQSLSEPFPEDKRYPDWIRDSLQGPLFHFGTDEGDVEVGAQPGIPGMDVLGDYVNAPGMTARGSMAPALKIPYELSRGFGNSQVAVDARTDIPTYDTSDYIDKQIPQASYFTGSTGRSLTQPWQAVGGAGKEPGEKANAQRQFLNWVTGLAFAQVDKPSYQKQAKREETTRKNNIKRKMRE